MVTILARLKAKPGKEKLLAEECVKIAQEVREKEKGCKMYVPHVSANNPGEFVFFEQYENQEAFDIHAGSPHFKALAKKFGDLLDGPPVIEKLNEIV